MQWTVITLNSVRIQTGIVNEEVCRRCQTGLRYKDKHEKELPLVTPSFSKNQYPTNRLVLYWTCHLEKNSRNFEEKQKSEYFKT